MFINVTAWTANVQPLCHNEPSENTNSNPATAHRQARTRRPPVRDLGLRRQAQRDAAFANPRHPARRFLRHWMLVAP